MAALADMDQRLIDLGEQLAQVRLPPLYRQTAYNARIHIELVRKRIDGLRDEITVKATE